MTHQELNGYFQRMLPEDFLSYHQLLDWQWLPLDALERGDARVGIGDRFRLSLLRPQASFPANESDFFRMYYCFSGNISFEFDKEEITLTSGQVLLTSRRVSHSIRPCSREDLCIHIAIHPELLAQQPGIRELPAFLDFLQEENCPEFRLFHTGRFPMARWYLEEMCCEHFDPDRHTYLMMPSLLFLLLPALDRCVDVESRGRSSPGRRTTEAIVRYIRTNFDTVTLQSTARRFGFAPNYLSYLLKKTTGMGFQELKQDAAISQGARMLLETNLTVAQIAQTVGIRNITHFYSLFSARYGVTPAQYRKNQA